MKGILILNEKEQRRLRVLNEVEKGKVRIEDAAEVLNISERQTWRLLAVYRKEGAAGLAHGNRGRKPGHGIGEEIRRQVIELAQTRYKEVNQQHFTDLLGEWEGLHLHRSTVRRILACAGIHSVRKRRAPKHRKRRERYPQEGMLLQVDGSRHDWLEGRGPWLTLIAGIDDATGKVPAALFRGQEDAQGYFQLMRQIVEKEGVPLAIYRDGHGIFAPVKKKPETMEEQLAGKREPTQFGRLLRELGIESIPARSPQAKGRVERLFGTFQSRLVSELRIKGIQTLEEANRYLKTFLPRFNRKFAVPAAQNEVIYRPVKRPKNLREVFCFKYWRSVGADNVVSFRHHRLQIFPTNGRKNYYRARVEVHEGMNGEIAIYYQGKCLVTKPAPLEAPVLRVQKMGKPPSGSNARQFREKPAELKPKPQRPKRTIPSPNHPWRRPWKKQRPNTDIFTEQLT
jgi:transposase